MLWTGLKSWLHRQWHGEPRTRPALEEQVDFDIDRLAELIERGDPKDLEEIARQFQS